MVVRDSVAVTEEIRARNFGNLLVLLDLPGIIQYQHFEGENPKNVIGNDGHLDARG